MTPTIAELTSPEQKTLVYIFGGVLLVGGLAMAVNAILKFFDRFRTPLVTAQEFAEYKRRVEWMENHIDLTLKQRVETAEHRIDQAFDKIDEVQTTMTAASESRSEKVLRAIEDLKRHR